MKIKEKAIRPLNIIAAKVMLIRY